MQGKVRSTYQVLQEKINTAQHPLTLLACHFTCKRWTLLNIPQHLVLGILQPKDESTQHAPTLNSFQLHKNVLPLVPAGKILSNLPHFPLFFSSTYRTFLMRISSNSFLHLPPPFPSHLGLTTRTYYHLIDALHYSLPTFNFSSQEFPSSPPPIFVSHANCPNSISPTHYAIEWASLSSTHCDIYSCL